MWSNIRSVIILVINKSDPRFAFVRFCHHSYDYRPNWTPLSPITSTYHAWNPAIYLDSKNTPSLPQNERPFSLHLTLQSNHFIVSVEQCIQLQSRKRAYKISCAPIVFILSNVLLHRLTYVNIKINIRTMDRGRHCSV